MIFLDMIGQICLGVCCIFTQSTVQFEFQFPRAVFMINFCLTARTLDLYHLDFTILVSFNHMFLQIMLVESFSITGVTSEPHQIFMFGFNVHF